VYSPWNLAGIPGRFLPAFTSSKVAGENQQDPGGHNSHSGRWGLPPPALFQRVSLGEKKSKELDILFNRKVILFIVADFKNLSSVTKP